MLNKIDKRLIYISLIFIITCLIICLLIIYPIRLVNSARVENIELERENLIIQNEIKELEDQNKALEKLTAVDIPLERAGLIEVFAGVQDIFKRNGLKIISALQNQNDSTITFKLEGGYYIFAVSLAEVRLLNNPVKVTALSLRKSSNDPVNSIEADLTLETLTE